MRRFIMPLCYVILVVSVMISPYRSFAGTVDIENDIKKIEQQVQAAAKKQQDAEKLKTVIKTQKNQEVATMNDLLKDINEQGAKLNELNKQKNTVTQTLRDTSQQLEDAEGRVSARDQQLRSRLRLMYMNGSVSYLDVIFSATSFADFLDRYYALKNIVGQDRTILEANKIDRNLVADKKKQVEEDFVKVKELFAQVETAKQALLVQEKQKEVVIASLDKKEHAVDEVSDDAQKEATALASQRAELYAKLRLEESKKKKLPPAFAYSGGKLAWPVPSSTTITSPFGYRVDPIKKVNKLHAGVDIGAPNGTTIVAAEDGTVIIASWVNGYGNTVVIDHGNGLWTWYGHIRDNGIKVDEGDSVKRGQKIAEVGSTGDSTGNHLHFEVRLNKIPVEPMPYLK